MKLIAVFVVCLATHAWGSIDQICIDQAQNIDTKLACLSNIEDIKEIKDNTNLPDNIRQFEMKIQQLVDKDKPHLGKFTQRLVLLHRDESEPMVLQTSGYSIYRIAQTAMTDLFQTNQLQIEHRFFEDSIPESKDWSQLNIKQSADDFHVITATFKQIYKQSWVGTGASKGGMTSTYHRFFYPNDLDGTVADVAPLSFSTSDQRYNQFIENVGGDEYKSCRSALADMQVLLLTNRDLFLPRLKGNFNQLGGAAVAFEHAVIESLFYFWQYGNADDPRKGCPALPINKSIQNVYDFVFQRASPLDYADDKLSFFTAYHYQAATELGSPDNVTTHVEPLRWFEFNINQYVPKGIEINYSNAHMHAIDRWVRTYADNIIFVYGEFDPWTAGEYPLSETGKSIYKYFAPKANHSANFTALSSSDREAAINTISQWLGKNPPEKSKQNFLGKSLNKKIFLEDLEFEMRKKHHLL